MNNNYQLLEEKIRHRIQDNDYTFSSFSDYSREQILSLFKKISLQL